MKQSRVFISYAHESQSHNNKVFELSERLRGDGVDCEIDQYQVSPSEGWPRWTKRQIEDSDFVILVCTKTYKSRYELSAVVGKGAGAKWEGTVISQHLYDSEGRNSKFIPVVFSEDDVSSIPSDMKGGTYYVLTSESEYDDLYRHLTDQPKTIKRELGKLRSLPPKRREEAFLQVSESAVPANTFPQEVPKQSSLVVLTVPSRSIPIFAAAERIRSAGKTISLKIRTDDSVSIQNLQHERNAIAIAYNDTAKTAKVWSIEQLIEGGKEWWQVELEEDQYVGWNQFEFSMNSVSADQIAEMRARRILLNEDLSNYYAGRIDRMTLQLLENSVAGNNPMLSVIESPFPRLFKDLRSSHLNFVECARLYAVLLLILTKTVQQINRLDLRIAADSKLNVTFVGTRAPKYFDKPPTQITLEGVCPLS